MITCRTTDYSQLLIYKMEIIAGTAPIFAVICQYLYIFTFSIVDSALEGGVGFVKFLLHDTIGEGCTNENPENVWSFGKPPSPPPPPVWHFFKKKFTPIFLLKIASLTAETNFTLGPTSKTKNFLCYFWS